MSVVVACSDERAVFIVIAGVDSLFDGARVLKTHF